MNELVLPDDVRYAKDHEWARSEGRRDPMWHQRLCPGSDGRHRVCGAAGGGGATFSRGDPFGTVESVKAVVELYMPVGGEVVAVNGELAASPGLVNEHPYGEGWIIQDQARRPGRAGPAHGKGVLSGNAERNGIDALFPSHRSGYPLHARNGRGRRPR